MTAPTVVVVGDSFLDSDIVGAVERVCPDSPAPVVDVRTIVARPGGAALAAALLADDGADVALVTALGADDAGCTLREQLERRGVTVEDLVLRGATPQKIRVRVDGQSLARLDHGGLPTGIGHPGRRALRRIVEADAVLVSDYGRGVTTVEPLRTAAGRARRLVWDPHPRGSTPMPGATLVTPNAREAAGSTGLPVADSHGAAAAQARLLARRWSAAAVAVTLGARGAVLVAHGAPALAVPVPEPARGDTCGAGDRFAGAAAQALARGAVISEAVEIGVRAATSFVAGSRAAEFARTSIGSTDINDAVGRVRSQGGTVVATGGCFDLIHAGHVAMLQAARQLGDCLVVLLNSDASVRRIKGDGRPLQGEADRAAVLGALGCVDGVVVFDEQTPVMALERLRPDVFVKGADYAVGELPERTVLERWGGSAVVVPYLDGRSTTRLVEEVVRRGSRC